MAHMSCWQKFCDAMGVGCCISEDEFKKRPLAELVQNSDRHCTDLPCLLVLILVFVTQIYLVIYASDNGADPDYLLHGWDYTGDLCDSNNADGSLNAWPDLETSYKVRICVSDCQETTSAYADSRMVTTYQSEEFLNAWCIPTTEALNNITVADYDFNSASEIYERAISDLNTTKWLILAAAGIAILVAFIYLKLVSCIARIVIWLTIILLFVGGFFMSYYLIVNGLSDSKESETEDTGKIELGIGICIAILLVLFLLGLLWCRKRIDLALELLNEAGHAIRDIKTTVLFPVIYSFIGISYIALWICIALYIYSVKIEKSGDMPSNLITPLNDATTYYYYSFDTSMENALIYHFICLFYIMQIIIYFGFMVLAGVIADWYFSNWDMSRKCKLRGNGPAELSYHPIYESLARVIRFHLGSLAFGAAILTIIRIIRGIVTYIQVKTKEAQNPLAKCLFCCAQCCLKCFECILDKISKEGFIFTTIYGTGFCYSSFQALKLLFTNIGRATVVEGISKYMEIFGRLAVAFSTTGLCLLIMTYDTYFQNNVSSFLFPMIIIFILSYIIGSLFMMVFEVGVDTIFLCFLVDESVHGEPKFASEKLMHLTSFREKNDKHDKNVNQGHFSRLDSV